MRCYLWFTLEKTWLLNGTRTVANIMTDVWHLTAMSFCLTSCVWKARCCSVALRRWKLFSGDTVQILLTIQTAIGEPLQPISSTLFVSPVYCSMRPLYFSLRQLQVHYLETAPVRGRWVVCRQQQTVECSFTVVSIWITLQGMADIHRGQSQPLFVGSSFIPQVSNSGFDCYERLLISDWSAINVFFYLDT